MSLGLSGEFLSRGAIEALGFAELGDEVLIHPTAVIVDCGSVRIGSHVRIDPFCVLSSKRIRIGDYVNIATNAALLGRGEIEIEDFASLAPGAQLLTTVDDFSGSGLIGPTVPERLRAARHGPVTLQRHAIVGSNAVILAGVTIGEGTVVGAMSLVKESLLPWGVYAGVPARRIRDRSKDALKAEASLRQRRDGDS